MLFTIFLWIIGVYVGGFALTFLILTVQDYADADENVILSSVWPLLLVVLIFEIIGI